MSESQHSGRGKDQRLSMDENELLQEYLKGQSDISLAYRDLQSVEPAAELDQTILHSAKTNLSSNFDQGKTKSRRWVAKLDSPFAMAAVIVICASLLLIFSQQQQLAEHQTSPDLVPTPVEQPAEEIQTSGIREPHHIDDSVIQQSENLEPSMIMKDESGQVSAVPSAIRQMREMKSEREADLSGSRSKLQERAKEKSLNSKSLKKKTSSAELLLNDVKIMINKGKIEDAKVLYQQFEKEFPDVNVSGWFSREELILLHR